MSVRTKLSLLLLWLAAALLPAWAQEQTTPAKTLQALDPKLNGYQRRPVRELLPVLVRQVSEAEPDSRRTNPLMGSSTN